MEDIEIEYNQNLKPLEALLSSGKQRGDFFVLGTTEMPLPRIEVEGGGLLSFPMIEAQIAAVVREAERAPYGRGRDTIIDTSIRNVWQIAPGKIKLAGNHGRQTSKRSNACFSDLPKLLKRWSGRRGSNSRRSAWEDDCKWETKEIAFPGTSFWRLRIPRFHSVVPSRR